MLHYRLRTQKAIIAFIFIATLFGIHFFPLTAQAACCKCEINDLQPKGIKKDQLVANICYTTLTALDTCEKTQDYKAEMSIDDALAMGKEYTNKVTIQGVKTQNGAYYKCSLQKDGQCAGQCPDVKESVQAFVPSGGGELKVYIAPSKRDPILFRPQVSIPGTRFLANMKPGTGIPLTSKTIGEYIAGLYYFIIASIGLLAVIGIMIGGFQYFIAGGPPEKITT